MFYDNFDKLCTKIGTSPTAFTKNVLGLSTSKVTAWKGGSIPKYEILQKIADVFNVSVGDLFDGEDEIPEDKKIAPGESTESDVEMRDVEMIAVKATEKQWTYILNKLSQENRDKLQEQAELLLLKQQVQADKEEK